MGALPNESLVEDNLANVTHNHYMKKKYLVYAAAPVLALSLFAANTAFAHGMFGWFGSTATPEQIATRQTTMFQEEANLLGVSVDEVKAAWAEGKTLWDLAQEKGLTQEQLKQKMTDARNAQVKSQLQTLVSQGVITQSQADQRYSWMTAQDQNGGKRLGRGFHGMRGMGMMF